MLSSIKTDPSRTGLLRRNYTKDMASKFRLLEQEIKIHIIDEDALGLDQDLVLNAVSGQVSDFAMWVRTKITEFVTWITQKIDEILLALDWQGRIWLRAQVLSAYTRGQRRAVTEIDKEGKLEELLMVVIPANEEKVNVLTLKTQMLLVGITAAMIASASNSVAKGLLNGESKANIAAEISRTNAKVFNTRVKPLVNTETMQAFVEGQLDTYESFNIDELELVAEWSSSGVACTKCSPMNGVRMPIEEARGLLPVHPNCKCIWVTVKKLISKSSLWTQK